MQPKNIIAAPSCLTKVLSHRIPIIYDTFHDVELSLLELRLHFLYNPKKLDNPLFHVVQKYLQQDYLQTYILRTLYFQKFFSRLSDSYLIRRHLILKTQQGNGEI
jgi:hypothetical protein